MGWEVTGVTEKLIHSVQFIGYKDSETVMLDFDNVCLEEVKHWAYEVMKRFELGGLLILESSERHYPVVFDRKISWAESIALAKW